MRPMLPQAAFLLAWLVATYLSTWMHISVAQGQAASVMETATEHNLVRVAYALACLIALNWAVAHFRARRQR